jgi:hypothetical protein
MEVGATRRERGLRDPVNAWLRRSFGTLVPALLELEERRGAGEGKWAMPTYAVREPSGDEY